jgi:hypothetical protein
MAASCFAALRTDAAPVPAIHKTILIYMALSSKGDAALAELADAVLHICAMERYCPGLRPETLGSISE